MNQAAISEQTAESVEATLRDELARGDAMIATARPILRHLLSNDDQALFSDEMIARVRGMMLDVAAQLLFAEAAADDARDRAGYVAERRDGLAQALFEDTAFLAHAHALALEAQLSERLQARSGIDAVLPPLVQELAAAKDPAMAGLAMSLLAAQARFMQHFRRMELPLRELPGDLFHKALLALRAQGAGPAEAAERALRDGYEEGAARLGLVARLVMGMGQGALRALSIHHAGLAVFATALAMAAGQERDRTVLSFAERQFARLALSLRAAGLKQQAVEEQFLYLHPEIALPDGFEMLRPDRAAALLSASQPEAAF
ncbi:MAG TPA: hypothetical protein VEB68_10635 [Croceibacterium sp.]|nr:hypothetical protein [Croceibacterium sp.]